MKGAARMHPDDLPDRPGRRDLREAVGLLATLAIEAAARILLPR